MGILQPTSQVPVYPEHIIKSPFYTFLYNRKCCPFGDHCIQIFSVITFFLDVWFLSNDLTQLWTRGVNISKMLWFFFLFILAWASFHFIRWPLPCYLFNYQVLSKSQWLYFPLSLPLPSSCGGLRGWVRYRSDNDIWSSSPSLIQCVCVHACAHVCTHMCV